MKQRLLSVLLLNGKPFQRIWERTRGLAIAGMNIGPADEVSSSGERWVFHHFLSKRRTRPLVFDVGANQGQWATMALSETQAVDLYCFEPSAFAFKQLSKSLSKFPAVQLFNVGLSDRVGTAPLYSDKPGSGLGSTFRRRLEYRHIAMFSQEEIQLTTIDRFCAERAIRHIDFLKLDVEGSELLVLAGAKEMLLNNGIDFIQFEFGGCNIDSRTFFQDFWYLLTPGYKIFRIVHNGLFPITSYKETLECFVTTNFAAIRNQADVF